MSDKLTLSILDIGPIPSNQSASDCFNSMLELAKLGERLGYHRYWLAEHHNVNAVAASHTASFAPGYWRCHQPHSHWRLHPAGPLPATVGGRANGPGGSLLSRPG